MLSKITRKAQEKLGLTRSEAGIVLFLAFGLVLGGTAKLLKLDKSAGRYDFTESDSIFAAASSKVDSVIAAEEDTTPVPAGHKTKSSSQVNFPINLNTATTEELTSLPGVGEVLANRIIKYRSSIGRFASREELMKVKGIGKSKFGAIKDLVRVD